MIYILLWSLFSFKHIESRENLQQIWLQNDSHSLFTTNWSTRSYLKYLSISIQWKHVKFGIATEIIWKPAATTNLRKMSSENLPFPLIHTKFGKTTHCKTNLFHSEQNPCLWFSRFFSIFPKCPMKNCHFLFQRISKLAHLMMSWRSNLQYGKYLEG